MDHLQTACPPPPGGVFGPLGSMGASCMREGHTCFEIHIGSKMKNIFPQARLVEKYITYIIFSKGIFFSVALQL